MEVHMKKHITLLNLTLGHFLVDLACLYFLFSTYPQNDLIAGVNAALLYNFLAFALQAVIGFFFDRFPARRSTSVGILLIVFGYGFGLYKLSAVGLVLCGLGNAFYHVGGSIGIARTDKKGVKDSGIFVSAGALGVSLGTYLANRFLSKITIGILLLLILLLFLQITITSPKRQSSDRICAGADAALLLLSLFAVFLRSLGGLFFPSSYKALFARPGHAALSLFLIAMASGFVAFLGKFLGGFLSNLCTFLLHKLPQVKKTDLRSGNYIFGIVTLLLSVFLLVSGKDIPLLCFFGILCFHAAMPVTLFELYCLLPDRPGFAMGLSTLMLFLGYLPYTFSPLDGLPGSLLLCLLTLLAAGYILLSLLIYRKSHTQRKDSE